MKTPVVFCLEGESTIDYDSFITKLIFTAGCNFKCSFCHNYKLVNPSLETLSYSELDEILKQAKKNWVDAICITGGEPTIHSGLIHLIQHIKSKGFKIKLDTNGSKPNQLEKVIKLVDYVAMDYKASLVNYSKITGISINPDHIKTSRDLLIQQAKDYEFRTTIVPGFHDADEIRRISRELQGARKYIIQAFVPKENLLDNDYIRVQRTKEPHLQKLHKICSSILTDCQVSIR